MGELPLFPLQSEGRARRALAAAYGCGRFFNCLRDTLSDRILAAYKAGEPRPDSPANAPGGANEPAVSSRGRRFDRPFAPSRFTFDGLAYHGYAGDTLASALIANGVHLVGRSFKYHRPRGILTAGAEEPNALVGVARAPAASTPNLRATQVELYDGLDGTSQNRWPSLAFDVGAINDLLSPLFGAGFYYKTFMGPNLSGRLGLEPGLRADDPPRRGSRRCAARARSGPLSRTFAHCDVLVVGAGPAGLAAALAASRKRRARGPLRRKSCVRRLAARRD